jgi:hypothetical protein
VAASNVPAADSTESTNQELLKETPKKATVTANTDTASLVNASGKTSASVSDKSTNKEISIAKGREKMETVDSENKAIVAANNVPTADSTMIVKKNLTEEPIQTANNTVKTDSISRVTNNNDIRSSGSNKGSNAEISVSPIQKNPVAETVNKTNTSNNTITNDSTKNIRKDAAQTNELVKKVEDNTDTIAQAVLRQKLQSEQKKGSNIVVTPEDEKTYITENLTIADIKRREKAQQINISDSVIIISVYDTVANNINKAASESEQAKLSDLAINNSASGKHYIGEFYAGGIVFYLTPSGNHGLVASLSDVFENNEKVAWCESTPYKIDNWANSNYDGMKNTNLIIASGIKSAAELCKKMGQGWYLPSVDELRVLEITLPILNNRLENDGDKSTQPLNFSPTGDFGICYWSSTKYNDNAAWSVVFSNGVNCALTKNTIEKQYVRAVKVF